MGILETLGNGVSPGMDKVPYEAYKVSPGIVATILARIGNYMARTGTPPKDFLDNLICLIPKIDQPVYTGHFRPITLTNSDYKIILRVWANRLGPILGKCVGEHQKGFIPGRDGREHVIVVQKVLDKCSKGKEGESSSWTWKKRLTGSCMKH